MRETWVQSLGQKDPQRRKWQPVHRVAKESDTTERLHFLPIAQYALGIQKEKKKKGILYIWTNDLQSYVTSPSTRGRTT